MQLKRGKFYIYIYISRAALGNEDEYVEKGFGKDQGKKSGQRVGGVQGVWGSLCNGAVGLPEMRII